MRAEPIRSIQAEPTETPARLLRCFTAVLWVGCVAIGASAWLNLHSTSAVSAKKVEPVAVQVQVALDASPNEAAAEQLNPENAAALSEIESPPATPSPPTADQPPALQAIAAMPNASNAFGQPMAVTANVPAATSRPASVAPHNPGVQRIMFGQGEGVQAAPEYPREAALAYQQGAVEVIFTIDPAGRVSDAAVSKPSIFPLLNQAALRAVRDRWRFETGDVRERVVTIDFQLR